MAERVTGVWEDVGYCSQDIPLELEEGVQESYCSG